MSDSTPTRADDFVPVYAFPHTVAMLSMIDETFDRPAIQGTCICGWRGEPRTFYPDALNDANAHVQSTCNPKDRA